MEANMKRISILLLVFCTCFDLALWSQAQPQRWQKIITFDAPGAGQSPGQGTLALSINAAGAVAGGYLDGNSVYHAFMRGPLGGIITFEAPGAGTSAYQGTAGESINSAGEIAGQYVDALCIEHGFLRTAGGKFTTFEAPGAGSTPGTCSASQSLQGTVATDINQGGTIAGYTLDVSNVYHGFVRTPGENFAIFNAQDAGTGSFQGIFPAGISGLNDPGDIAGTYVDSGNVPHGFVRSGNGNITEFDVMGAQGTFSASINTGGVIAGEYLDANSAYHGFVRSSNGAITTFDVKGAGNGAGQGTEPESINSEGAITGQYIDAQGVNHGFVRSPYGIITTFDVPRAGNGAGQGTIPMSISMSDYMIGGVTGYYLDANNVVHGFLWIP